MNFNNSDVKKECAFWNCRMGAGQSGGGGEYDPRYDDTPTPGPKNSQRRPKPRYKAPTLAPNVSMIFFL